MEAVNREGILVIRLCDRIDSLNADDVKKELQGIVEKEAPIDASNVMLYDKKAKAASRIGFKFNEKGEKKRVFKKSGEEVDKGGKK